MVREFKRPLVSEAILVVALFLTGVMVGLNVGKSSNLRALTSIPDLSHNLEGELILGAVLAVVALIIVIVIIILLKRRPNDPNYGSDLV